MPAAVDGWTTRSFRPHDEPAIREIVVRSFEQGDLSDWSRLDVEQLVGSIPNDPEGAVVGVVNGEVVGFVWPHQEQLFVHPDRRRRGHGRSLVEAGRAWVRQHGDPVLALAVPHGPAARSFATQLGFRYHSSLWLLRLPAEREVPAPAFPAGIVAFKFPPDFAIATYVDLINRAFADHPSPLRVAEETIRRSHGSPTFDPEDILLVAPAGTTDRPVAFCRSKVLRDDGTRVGEITLIGVLPDWRGQGLGRELLRWGVAHLRARGVAALTLTVEARNDRALRLYERTGFVRVREWPRWAVPA